MEKNVKGNKGFSLITVIITVAFIGILGLLVLYLALQNFNMKITAGCLCFMVWQPVKWSNGSF